MSQLAIKDNFETCLNKSLFPHVTFYFNSSEVFLNTNNPEGVIEEVGSLTKVFFISFYWQSFHVFLLRICEKNVPR